MKGFMTPILYTYENWINSQLSVARFFGCAKINGVMYYIMPPKNDLVSEKYVSLYKKWRRDKFIEVLQSGADCSTPKKMEVELKRLSLLKTKVKQQTMFP